MGVESLGPMLQAGVVLHPHGPGGSRGARECLGAHRAIPLKSTTCSSHAHTSRLPNHSGQEEGDKVLPPSSLLHPLYLLLFRKSPSVFVEHQCLNLKGFMGQQGLLGYDPRLDVLPSEPCVQQLSVTSREENGCRQACSLVIQLFL